MGALYGNQGILIPRPNSVNNTGTTSPGILINNRGGILSSAPKPNSSGEYVNINGQNFPKESIVSNIQSKPSNIVDSAKSILEKLGTAAGKKLQKVPNVNLGTKGKDIFKSTPTEEQIVNFISNFPSAMVQSWGKSLELVSSDSGRKEITEGAKNLPKTLNDAKTQIQNGQWGEALNTVFSNPAVSVGLDVSDFIPLAGLATKGVKVGLRKAAKQLVKDAVQETGEKEIKTVTNNLKTTQQIKQRNIKDLVVHENAPDKETIVKYKEEIKSGGKPTVLIVKEGKKFGVEDGKHKLEAYKQLGITDIPTIEKVVAPKPKIVKVPKEQLPIGGGIEKASRLEARVTDSLNKTPQEIKDQLGSTFNQMNKKEELSWASKYVTENSSEALKVLEGKIETPKGHLKNSIYVAMENAAKEDAPLARKLASLASTRAGQELSILTEIDPNSPVKAIREIIQIRGDTFTKKYGKKIDIDKVTEKITKDIKSNIKVPDKNDWGRFIQSISC